MIYKYFTASIPVVLHQVIWYDETKNVTEINGLILMLYMKADYLNKGYGPKWKCYLLEVFLKELNLHLRNVSKISKRTTENSERLGRQAQLGSKTTTPVYHCNEWEHQSNI